MREREAQKMGMGVQRTRARRHASLELLVVVLGVV